MIGDVQIFQWEVRDAVKSPFLSQWNTYYLEQRHVVW